MVLRSVKQSGYRPITNLAIDKIGCASNDGFIWVTVAGIRVYSCYWSPNSAKAEYEDFLERLEFSIRSSPTAVIITGDFNAKHSAGDHL